MSLFEELKRRKVFRLAIAYLVVAWLILQVVDVINEPLNLPDWFDTVVIVFLGLMFPIALMLSWAYDVTPDGVVTDDGKEVRAGGIDYGKISLGAVIFLGAFLAGNYFTGSTSSSSRSFEIADSLPLRQIRFPMTGVDYGQFQSMTLEITPDGQTFVYRVLIDGRGHLVSRRLDELHFELVEGGQNARWVYALSPDGNTIVFQDEVDNLLKKIPIEGGPALAFHDPQGAILEMAWGSTGSIVYGTGNHHGLFRIPENGGEREVLTSTDSDVDHKHPEFLPGTDTLLIAIGPRSVARLPSDELAFVTADGEVVRTGIFGAAPTVTEAGELLYFNQNALWTAHLDIAEMSISRDPIAVMGSMEYAWNGIFAVSDEGTLVHRAFRFRPEEQVVVVARDGTEQVIPGPTGLLGDVSPSPDGRLFAIVEATEYGADLFVRSMDGSESWQVTNQYWLEAAPTWSDDGRYIYFSAGPRDDMFRYDVIARSEPERLTRTQTIQYVGSVSADGQKLFLSETREDYFYMGIAEYDIATGAETRFLIDELSYDVQPMISPAGNWLAFESDRSGTDEIYLRPYPAVSEQLIKVSTGGGQNPMWNEDGTELFYWGETHIMAVSVATSDQNGISVSQPMLLFEHSGYDIDTRAQYYLAPDQFMFVKMPADGNPIVNEFVMIQNWPALLEADIN